MWTNFAYLNTYYSIFAIIAQECVSEKDILAQEIPMQLSLFFFFGGGGHQVDLRFYDYIIKGKDDASYLWLYPVTQYKISTYY